VQDAGAGQQCGEAEGHGVPRRAVGRLEVHQSRVPVGCGCDAAQAADPPRITVAQPIPADLARALATANLGPEATTVFRRFYTHPDTGHLAATDSTARRFPTVMQQFLLVRDRTCRTPYCHAPGRHHDHQHDHAKTGPTTLDNGQLTCQACNHTKQAPGWTARPINGPPDQRHTIETVLPTGHTTRTTAPSTPTPATLQPVSRAETYLLEVVLAA